MNFKYRYYKTTQVSDANAFDLEAYHEYFYFAHKG